MDPVKTQVKLSLSRIFLIAAVVIAIGWIAMRIALPNNPTIFSGTRPATLGVRAGQLAPCPNTPNCVSSQSDDIDHYIDPLADNGQASAPLSRLEQIVNETKRAKVIARADNYLYAQFTSRWMGFVDDVEFFEDDAGEIEVRSASRLGESDLGVNRSRIETLRSQFQGQ
ncbi:MAG: DUF1499 domain-containing protein [Cyanobacteriota bacterium]|nr:DUF1499 domain-containing protein [Cyanobacteriota bacterium]